jgi:hypothetical protein
MQLFYKRLIPSTDLPARVSDEVRKEAREWCTQRSQAEASEQNKRNGSRRMDEEETETAIFFFPSDDDEL